MSDFGGLPPEINSARMYAGPGPGSLLVAAAAWDALAQELESFAAAYSAILAELHGQSWSGPASSTMVAAAAPYMTWAATTAGQAEDAAGRARAAVGAFEVAFVATVPPAVVAANRTMLAALVATNFFGQNTSAIAATEAAYAEMWAQDAAAMYGYAASASTAATLTSFGPAPRTTNAAGQLRSGDAVEQAVHSSAASSSSTLSQLMPATALSSAAQPDASALSTSITNAVAPIAAFDYGLDTTILGFEIPKTLFQGGSYFLAAQRSGLQDSDLPVRPPSPYVSTMQAYSPPGPSKPVLASVGRSVPLSGMSVPQNWAAADPSNSLAAESVASSDPASRVLPPWVSEKTPASAGIPTAGRTPAPSGRRQSNAGLRMQDRRYRIPRPPVGG